MITIITITKSNIFLIYYSFSNKLAITGQNIKNSMIIAFPTVSTCCNTYAQTTKRQNYNITTTHPIPITPLSDNNTPRTIV